MHNPDPVDIKDIADDVELTAEEMEDVKGGSVGFVPSAFNGVPGTSQQAPTISTSKPPVGGTDQTKLSGS